MTSAGYANRFSRLFFLAVGTLLIVAAALKGHQLTFEGTPATTLSRDIPLSIALILMEFAFGAWLITGLYPTWTRRALMLVFAGLLEVALWSATSGHKSCGCFGQIELSPWIAAAIDAAIILIAFFLPRTKSEPAFQTHNARLYAYLVFILAVGVPAAATMSVYRCEVKPNNLPLRHDRTLHYAKITVDLKDPKSEDVLALVARETGLSLIVDTTVEEPFASAQPNWERINHKTVNGWEALEAISNRLSVRSRWVKTMSGYTLLRDDPIQRARNFWFAGIAAGLLGLGAVALTRRKNSVPQPSS